jgi:hypothetical protein
VVGCGGEGACGADIASRKGGGGHQQQGVVGLMLVSAVHRYVMTWHWRGQGGGLLARWWGALAAEQRSRRGLMVLVQRETSWGGGRVGLCGIAQWDGRPLWLRRLW